MHAIQQLQMRGFRIALAALFHLFFSFSLFFVHNFGGSHFENENNHKICDHIKWITLFERSKWTILKVETYRRGTNEIMRRRVVQSDIELYFGVPLISYIFILWICVSRFLGVYRMHSCSIHCFPTPHFYLMLFSFIAVHVFFTLCTFNYAHLYRLQYRI